MIRTRALLLVAALATALALPTATASAAATVAPLATLPSGTGSAIGPGGDLFVASPSDGSIYRIDRRTHAVSTFHTGLPLPVFPVGGVMDVAFQGSTAYALVTIVGPDVGGTDTVGIYRLDGPTSATPVADLGTWSIDHPPVPDFFIPSGVQYAFEAYRGGFLVTDGHHNRVLRVGTDGSISEFATFEDIVPTGLDTWGDTVLVGEAGPIPHLPADGRVVAVDARTGDETGVVTTGTPLLVDVERGRGTSLYTLGQGYFTPGQDDGSPAEPDTGVLMRVGEDGSVLPVATGLDRPTSLEVRGDTAYVVGLAGEVVAVDLG
jgi:hypothetical protein